LKKDPGIPNLFPYKEKILQEIEEKKRLKEEEATRRKADAKAQASGTKVQEEQDVIQVDDDVMYDLGSEDELDNETMEDSVNPMAALLASARARAVEYEQDRTDDNEEDMQDEEWYGFEDEERDNAKHPTAATRPDTSRKAYDKIFKQVVDSADVILYVLDARDPEGTRSKEVERQVISADGGNKRLILILNKIDLVPSSVLKAWLTHLRRYFPTLPTHESSTTNSSPSKALPKHFSKPSNPMPSPNP
jgi:nuclear GTP-binding protein